jgi:hypothetical protein
VSRILVLLLLATTPAAAQPGASDPTPETLRASGFFEASVWIGGSSAEYFGERHPESAVRITGGLHLERGAWSARLGASLGGYLMLASSPGSSAFGQIVVGPELQLDRSIGGGYRLGPMVGAEAALAPFQGGTRSMRFGVRLRRGQFHAGFDVIVSTGTEYNDVPGSSLVGMMFGVGGAGRKSVYLIGAGALTAILAFVYLQNNDNSN